MHSQSGVTDDGLVGARSKAKSSQLVELCRTEGQQLVTRRGKNVAVLISVDEVRRMQAAQPSLKQLLLKGAPK